MPKKTAHSYKKSGWKAAQSHNKNKQKTKLAFLVLGLIISLFFITKFIQVFKFFVQPPSSIIKDYVWDGSTNINLVFKSDQVSVLSFNPEQNSIQIVKIPEETYINVPGGYGNWPLRSVYGLGQSEKTPKGPMLLIASLGSFLGMPFDGYLESNTSPEELIKSLKNPLNLPGVWSSYKSSLSPMEFIRLTLALKGVRFDKVKTYDLGKLDLLTESTLPDGIKVFIADNIKIDAFSQKFSEDKIGEERISVAVFNGTKTPGLAQKAARLVTNLGGHAIISANADVDFKQARIVVNEEKSQVKDSYTYKRLTQVFGSDCSSTPKCGKIPSEVLESRAQINIILGSDFASKY